MSRDEIDKWEVKRRFLWVLEDLGIITSDEHWDESLSNWRNK